MKVILFNLIVLLMTSFSVFSEPLKIEVNAECAILMNADSGAILYEKDAYSLQYPASTTKIATALYALHLKKDHWDTLVCAEAESLTPTTHEAKRKVDYVLPSYWLETDGTHIGIKRDEELSFNDLFKGMLISSGNDAANVLAQGVSGTIPSFIEGMNGYLKEIGCLHTNYLNPHGLHHPQHQTTAYDLAWMTREALKNPVFCDAVAQTRFLRPKTNKQKATTLLQTNRLLRQGKNYYAKAIGVKTGYHAKAKKTFVSAARSNGRTLIAVLLRNDDRNKMFQDSVKLFEAAFNQPKIHHTLLKAGLQTFSLTFKNADKKVQTYSVEELSLDYYPAEDPKAKCLLYWDTVVLPITKNQKIGDLHLVDQQGLVLKKISLFARDDVSLKWPYNWLQVIKDGFNNHPFLSTFAFLSFIIILFLGIRMFFRG